MAPKAGGSEVRRKGRGLEGRRRDASPAPASSSSVNQLKSRIRDITRVLQHSERLPAGARVDKERALASYKEDLDTATRAKKKRQMIQKYHKVRFFERQKATRQLKKLRIRLEKGTSGSAETTSLQSEVHAAEVDLNYTLFYPLDEKYISLFPRSGRGKIDTSTKQNSEKRPSLWKVVEQCMADESLEKLRDGKLSLKLTGGDETSRQTASKTMAASKQPQNHSTAWHSSGVQGDDSDGGFFEE